MGAYNNRSLFTSASFSIYTILGIFEPLSSKGKSSFPWYHSFVITLKSFDIDKGICKIAAKRSDIFGKLFHASRLFRDRYRLIRGIRRYARLRMILIDLVLPLNLWTWLPKALYSVIAYPKHRINNKATQQISWILETFWQLINDSERSTISRKINV